MSEFDKDTMTAPASKHGQAQSAVNGEDYLPAMVPESWSKCVECHSPTANDVCSDECRVEWSARWGAVSSHVSGS